MSIPGATGDTLADAPVADDAEGRPASSGHGPAAACRPPTGSPMPAPERRVDPREAAREGEHRYPHVLRDAGLGGRRRGEPGPWGKSGAIDAIEAGAGHCTSFKRPAAAPISRGEPEADQDVHGRELRDDARLVGHADLARHGQMRAHPRREAAEKVPAKARGS